MKTRTIAWMAGGSGVIWLLISIFFYRDDPTFSSIFGFYACLCFSILLYEEVPRLFNRISMWFWRRKHLPKVGEFIEIGDTLGRVTEVDDTTITVEPYPKKEAKEQD